MTPLIIESWPGGVCTQANPGVHVKLDRLWQYEITVSTGTPCDLCASAYKIREFRIGSQTSWILADNIRRDRRVQMLFYPASCSTKVWHPRGFTNADVTILVDPLEYAIGHHCEPDTHYTASLQCGGLAGSSQEHPHMHWYTPNASSVAAVLRERDDIRDYLSRSSRRVIDLGCDGVACVAGGAFTGQCYLVPTDKDFLTPGQAFSALRALTALYDRKFMSAQGLVPEYDFVIEVADGGILFATYFPVLSQWGGAQRRSVGGSVEPISLAWSHDATVRHLNS
jgi:hypothetical protein